MSIRLGRIILTLALLYGVYTETGLWTTLALLIVFVILELNDVGL